MKKNYVDNNYQNINNTIKFANNNDISINNINYYYNKNNFDNKNSNQYNFEEDFVTFDNNDYNNDNNDFNSNFDNNHEDFSNYKFNEYNENNKYFETDSDPFKFGDDDDEDEKEQFIEGILTNLNKKNSNNNNLSVLSSYMRSSQKFSFNKTINTEKLFGTKGLFKIENSNLFNPVFQCLSNIFPFTEYFLKDQHKYEINENNPLSSFGNITIAYAELLKIIWKEKINIMFIVIY